MKREARDDDDDDGDYVARKMKQRRVTALGEEGNNNNNSDGKSDQKNKSSAADDRDDDDDDEDAQDQDGNDDQNDADDDEDEDDNENENFEYNDDEERQEENERMIALLNTFTPEQLERYEHFRRSHLLKPQVRQIMDRVLTTIFSSQQSSIPITLADKLLIVMSGISKMYAGELVESARQVMEDREETGVIQPRHLREAHRRMRRDGKILYLQNSNYNFFKSI